MNIKRNYETSRVIDLYTYRIEKTSSECDVHKGHCTSICIGIEPVIVSTVFINTS